MNLRALLETFIKKPKTVYFIYALLGLTQVLVLEGRNFVSDDFEAVYRVANNDWGLSNGFFRPIADFSLFLNFYISGYAPTSYYIFNTLVHTVNACFIFSGVRFVFKNHTSNSVQLATISGLFFLIYPFHSESLYWIVGRGASMSTLFALSSLYFLCIDKRLYINLSFASICFFLSLLTYESILLFPLIALMLQYCLNVGRKKMFYTQLFLWLTLFCNFCIRLFVNGHLWNDYASFVPAQSYLHWVEHFLKLFVRLYTPPMSRSVLFLIVAFIGLAIITVLLIHGYRKINHRQLFLKHPIAFVFGSLLLSIISVSAFPISTHTSETDRLLYLPSVFFIPLVVYLVITMDVTFLWRRIIFLILFAGSFISSYVHFENWCMASSYSQRIIDNMASAFPTHKHIYMFDLPSDYKGAYIFRHGFVEAMGIIYGHKGTITVINTVEKGMYPTTPKPYRLLKQKDSEMLIDNKGKLFLCKSDTTLLLRWSAGKIIEIPF